MVVIRVDIRRTRGKSTTLPPREQVGGVAPSCRFSAGVPALVVGPDAHAGVPAGMVAVRVGEVTVPVLAVLSSESCCDVTTVKRAVPIHTVPVPDACWHVAVLPSCVRVVCVAPWPSLVSPCGDSDGFNRYHRLTHML